MRASLEVAAGAAFSLGVGPAAQQTAGGAMKSLVAKSVRFLAAEEGPTAVEYAMMVLLVFLACLSTVIMLGQSTATSIESSSNSLQSALEEAR